MNFNNALAGAGLQDIGDTSMLHMMQALLGNQTQHVPCFVPDAGGVAGAVVGMAETACRRSDSQK